jgi:DNA-nicking Smr family endonuclease
MSRPRILSRDERALWQAVARTIKPLGSRELIVEPANEPGGAKLAAATAAPALSRPSRQTLAPTPPPIQPIERRLVRALQRGRRAADAVIDLHGMRQETAHSALRRFLVAEQARGASLVVVVTGKGAANPDGGGDGERGVLRRQVPHWLRLPDMRSIVLGFENAGPRHGGAGALYVRLRRGGRT